MSDDTATPTPADVAPEQPAEQAESPSWDDLFKGEDPVKVREALEHARKWEKRAKDNKAAADRAAELERESQTAEERIAALEKRYQDAEAARLRADIASRYGLAPEDRDLFLTASDEEGLEIQARRLSERAAELSSPRRPQPDPNQGRVGGEALSAEDAFIAFTQHT